MLCFASAGEFAVEKLIDSTSEDESWVITRNSMPNDQVYLLSLGAHSSDMAYCRIVAQISSSL